MPQRPEESAHQDWSWNTCLNQVRQQIAPPAKFFSSGADRLCRAKEHCEAYEGRKRGMSSKKREEQGDRGGGMKVHKRGESCYPGQSIGDQANSDRDEQCHSNRVPCPSSMHAERDRGEAFTHGETGHQARQSRRPHETKHTEGILFDDAHPFKKDRERQHQQKKENQATTGMPLVFVESRSGCG